MYWLSWNKRSQLVIWSTHTGQCNHKVAGRRKKPKTSPATGLNQRRTILSPHCLHFKKCFKCTLRWASKYDTQLLQMLFFNLGFGTVPAFWLQVRTWNGSALSQGNCIIKKGHLVAEIRENLLPPADIVWVCLRRDVDFYILHIANVQSWWNWGCACDFNCSFVFITVASIESYVHR